MTSADAPAHAGRWKAWTVFLLGALVVALAGTPWPARFVGLDRMVADTVAERTGLRLAGMSGEPMLRLLPSPRVILKGPRFRSETLDIVAGEIDARIGLTPLLPGGARITRLVVSAPTVTVRSAGGAEPLRLLADLLPAAAGLSDLIVRDGTWLDAAGSRNAREINLSFLPGRGERALRLQAIAGEEPLSLSAGMAAGPGERPRAALLDLRSGPLSLRFSGEVTLAPQPVATGEVQATREGAGRFAGWVPDLWRELPDGRLALSGTGRLRSDGFQLIDTTVETVAGPFTGTLAGRLDSGQRPALSGTLHAPSLDLTPVSAEHIWPPPPGPARLLALADVDLRLSARRTAVVGRVLEDAGLSLLARQGRLEASLGESRLGKGRLRGRIVLQDVVNAPDVRLTAQWDGIDLETLGGSRLAPHLTAGLISGQLQAESRGASAEALLAAASGRLGLSLAGGETQAFDLFRLSQRPPRGAQAGLARAVQGRGQIDQAQATVLLAAGKARIDEGFVRVGPLRAPMSGSIDLDDGTVALEIGVGLPRGDSPMPQAGRLLVRGVWPRLSYVFDMPPDRDAGLILAP